MPPGVNLLRGGIARFPLKWSYSTNLLRSRFWNSLFSNKNHLVDASGCSSDKMYHIQLLPTHNSYSDNLSLLLETYQAQHIQQYKKTKLCLEPPSFMLYNNLTNRHQAYFHNFKFDEDISKYPYLYKYIRDYLDDSSFSIESIRCKLITSNVIGLEVEINDNSFVEICSSSVQSIPCAYSYAHSYAIVK
jgi:hypothetical protein